MSKVDDNFLYISGSELEETCNKRQRSESCDNRRKSRDDEIKQKLVHDETVSSSLDKKQNSKMKDCEQKVAPNQIKKKNHFSTDLPNYQNHASITNNSMNHFINKILLQNDPDSTNFPDNELANVKVNYQTPHYIKNSDQREFYNTSQFDYKKSSNPSSNFIDGTSRDNFNCTNQNGSPNSMALMQISHSEDKHHNLYRAAGHYAYTNENRKGACDLPKLSPLEHYKNVNNSKTLIPSSIKRYSPSSGNMTKHDDVTFADLNKTTGTLLNIKTKTPNKKSHIEFSNMNFDFLKSIKTNQNDSNNFNSNNENQQHNDKNKASSKCRFEGNQKIAKISKSREETFQMCDDKNSSNVNQRSSNLPSIIWTLNRYKIVELNQLYTHKLPIIVKVERGYNGGEISLRSEETILIFAFGCQKRVIANEKTRRFSLPINSDISSYNKEINGDDDIDVKYKNDEIIEISANQQLDESIFKSTYFNAYRINNGWLDTSTVLVAHEELRPNFLIAVGLAASTPEEFTEYIEMFSRVAKLSIKPIQPYEGRIYYDWSEAENMDSPIGFLPIKPQLLADLYRLPSLRNKTHHPNKSPTQMIDDSVLGGQYHNHFDVEWFTKKVIPHNELSAKEDERRKSSVELHKLYLQNNSSNNMVNYLYEDGFTTKKVIPSYDDLFLKYDEGSKTLVDHYNLKSDEYQKALSLNYLKNNSKDDDGRMVRSKSKSVGKLDNIRLKTFNEEQNTVGGRLCCINNQTNLNTSCSPQFIDYVNNDFLCKASDKSHACSHIKNNCLYNSVCYNFQRSNYTGCQCQNFLNANKVFKNYCYSCKNKNENICEMCYNNINKFTTGINCREKHINNDCNLCNQHEIYENNFKSKHTLMCNENQQKCFKCVEYNNLHLNYCEKCSNVQKNITSNSCLHSGLNNIDDMRKLSLESNNCLKAQALRKRSVPSMGTTSMSQFKKCEHLVHENTLLETNFQCDNKNFKPVIFSTCIRSKTNGKDDNNRKLLDGGAISNSAINTNEILNVKSARKSDTLRSLDEGYATKESNKGCENNEENKQDELMDADAKCHKEELCDEALKNNCINIDPKIAYF